MNQATLTVKENMSLTPTTYRMQLAGDVSAITAPGQFINIALDGHFLRRPISVCDLEPAAAEGRDGTVTIIYKVLGRGTEEMTHFEPGKRLDVLTGLGNGYDLSCAGDRPLLIGGGVGIPPLYLAAKRLAATRAHGPGPEGNDGRCVNVILGFNSADEIYYEDEFRALGCEVVIATADGSAGIKGFVTDAFRLFNTERSAEWEIDGVADEAGFTHFYTCGPGPMLRAVYEEVYEKAGISGQMSFEERMGCGFGACMGCSIKVKDGYKRICKDGPVLRTEEIIWQ